MQEVVECDCTPGVADVDRDGSLGDLIGSRATEGCSEGDGSRSQDRRMELLDPEGLESTIRSV